MASTKLMETKDGRKFYRIQVSKGHGITPYTTRWYIPDGWSKRSIERGLEKAASEFEAACAAGEVMRRVDERQQKAEAEAEAAKIQTVRQYSEQVYMPRLRLTCAEHTRDCYQRNLDHYIYPAIGDIKLPEVSSAQLNALLTSAQGKGLKVGTVLKIYVVLSCLFKAAYMEDMIDRNPMDKVHRPKPTQAEAMEEAESSKSYTEVEVAKIRRCLADEPLKWRCLVELLTDTGCRRAEALGLTWSCVDLSKGTITIKRNLNYTKQKGIYIGPTKTKQVRTISIAPNVISLLRQLRQEDASSTKLVRLHDLGVYDFVFLQDGTADPMHPDSPTRYFKKFSARYGIDDFHPHKLRHTNASISITNGADIASVSERLGHADKSTTLRMYTHADEESMDRAADIFRKATGNA